MVVGNGLVGIACNLLGACPQRYFNFEPSENCFAFWDSFRVLVAFMSEHLNWILVHLSSLNVNWQNFGGKLESLGGISPWTTEDMHFNRHYEIVLIILEYICLNHASHQSTCYGVRVSKTQNPCKISIHRFSIVQMYTYYHVQLRGLELVSLLYQLVHVHMSMDTGNPK